jgi:hypothetical protein
MLVMQNPNKKRLWCGIALYFSDKLRKMETDQRPIHELETMAQEIVEKAHTETQYFIEIPCQSAKIVNLVITALRHNENVTLRIVAKISRYEELVFRCDIQELEQALQVIELFEQNYKP